jgi:hypothetical protein
MKAVITLADNPQTYIDLSLRETDHIPLFGVKIPLGIEFLLTATLFSFSTSFKQNLFVIKTAQNKLKKPLFLTLKLPEII